MIVFIDIGGTPANILERNLFRVAKLNGIKQERLIAILDPFDLSRAERKLVLGDYKTSAIKFPVEIPNNQTNLNSEKVSPPNPEECRRLLQSVDNLIIGKIQGIYSKKLNVIEVRQRYCKFVKDTENLAKISGNLREFMNGIVTLLSPDLKLVKLEDILSRNSQIVCEILEKTDIPVRAICPSCNCFVQMSLREKTPCCGISNGEIIQSGKYIPQAGFFAVILYLCGYEVYSNNTEKEMQAKEIMSRITKTDFLLARYSEMQNRTMVESYLLGD